MEVYVTLEFAFEQRFDPFRSVVAGRSCTLHHQVRLPDHLIPRILHQKPAHINLRQAPTTIENQDQQQIHFGQQFHDFV